MNNGLYFVMHLVIKLDAVHLADTIEQKRKQSKRGTEGQVNRMAEYIMKHERDMDGIDCYITKGELIRCKDCKHHHYQDDIPYCDRIDYGYGWKDEDYCSGAERKSE